MVGCSATAAAGNAHLSHARRLPMVQALGYPIPPAPGTGTPRHEGRKHSAQWLLHNTQLQCSVVQPRQGAATAVVPNLRCSPAGWVVCGGPTVAATQGVTTAFLRLCMRPRLAGRVRGAHTHTQRHSVPACAGTRCSVRWMPLTRWRATCAQVCRSVCASSLVARWTRRWGCRSRPSGPNP